MLIFRRARDPAPSRSMRCWRSCKASADRIDRQHCGSIPASAQKRDETRKGMILAAAALAFTSLNARAQTDLKAYADANGYLHVQKLTCAQLAGTWQEDADNLMVWYSGWYNGLAKKHFFNVSRGVRLQHGGNVDCQGKPNIRGIDATADP